MVSSRRYSHLNICHSDSHVLELVVFPSIGGPFNHSKSSVILESVSADSRPLPCLSTHKFIILDVQQNELWPEMSLLRSPDDLGDVDASNEKFQVLHHL